MSIFMKLILTFGFMLVGVCFAGLCTIKNDKLQKILSIMAGVLLFGVLATSITWIWMVA